MRRLPFLVMAFSLAYVFAKPHYGNRHGGQRGFFPPRIMKELQLSKQQIKEIMKFRYQQKKKMIAQKAKIEQLEEDLRFIFTQYPLDKKKLGKIKTDLIHAKSQLSELRIDGMSYFIEQLTEQQHSRFVDLQLQQPSKYRGGEATGKPRRFSNPKEGSKQE